MADGDLLSQFDAQHGITAQPASNDDLLTRFDKSQIKPYGDGNAPPGATVLPAPSLLKRVENWFGGFGGGDKTSDQSLSDLVTGAPPATSSAPTQPKSLGDQVLAALSATHEVPVVTAAERGTASGALKGLAGVENLLGGVPATVGQVIGKPELGDLFFNAGDKLRAASNDVLDTQASGAPALAQNVASGLTSFAVGGPEVAAGSAAVNRAAAGAQSGEPLSTQAKAAALEGALTEAGGRIPIGGGSLGKNLALGVGAGVGLPVAQHLGDRFLLGDKDASVLPSAGEIGESTLVSTLLPMLHAAGARAFEKMATPKAPVDTSAAEDVLRKANFSQAQIDALKRDGSLADIVQAATPAPTPMLEAPVVHVDSQGNAATPVQAAADAARKASLGLTPDVERAQQAREASAQVAGAQASQDVDANAKPPVTPERVVVAPTPLGAGLSADGKTMYVDPHIPPVLPVERADGSVAHVVLYDPNNPTVGGLVTHEGNEFPQMDERGKDYADAHNENANAAEDAYYQQKYGVSRAAVDTALKPYLDAAHARSAGHPDIPTDLDRTPYEDSGEAALLARGAPGESPKPEDRPAAAAQIDPQLARAVYANLPNEIGWDQVGGRIIRNGSQGADGIGPDPGRAGGDVVGRTTWIAKPGLGGDESTFWRNRPEPKAISAAKAKAAFAKEAAGQPLEPVERRFIDYAHQHADEVAQAHAEEVMRYEGEQRELDDEARVQAHAERSNAGVDVAPEDAQDALTVTQWGQRALDAGMTSDEMLAAMGPDGTIPERVARLASAIREREDGTQQPADSGNLQGRGVREADAGVGAGEAVARAQDQGGDLFAAPTGRERLRAAAAAKDADRNGLTGSGRTDIHAGPGTLFEGRAPEQADIEGAPRRFPTQKEAGMYAATLRGDARVRRVTGEDGKPAWEVTQQDSRGAMEARDEPAAVNEVRESDLSHEDQELVRQVRERQSAARDNTTTQDHLRQESVERGEREAGELGLRGAVVEALGADRVGHVHFVHDEDGLPPDVQARGTPIAQGNVRYGLHTSDGETYIFTKHSKTPARAIWTAWHENGHEAISRIVASHPDVKVGNMKVGEAHQKAREMFLQNPTVARVAEAIGGQRKSADLPRMAEEAMAELHAARQSGDWDAIKRKYGVDVPRSLREGVGRAVDNFVRRIKAILNAVYARISGDNSKPYSDADVADFLTSMHEAGTGDRTEASERMEAPDLDRVPFERAHPDLASEEVGKPVSVTTNELPSGDLAETRIAVRAKARELFAGRTYQTADGDRVLVPWSGIKHGTSGNPNANALAAMLHIDDLLESSHRVSSEPDKENRPSVVAVHQYEAPMTIDGRSASARIYVREHGDGHRYYDHAVIENKEPSGISGGSIREDSRPTQPAEGSGATLPRTDGEDLASEEPQDRADDMGRGASGPAPDEVTGVKNAQTKAERAARGLDELDAEGRRSFPQVWDAAAEKLKDDPHAGQALAEHVAQNPRALTAEETALLAQDRARISVNRRQAADDVNKAVESGSQVDEAIARGKLKLANDEMDVNDKAARQSGYEQGLGLAIRQAMAKLDYSLDAMEHRLQAAKGKPLDTAELKKLKDLHDAMQAKEAELAGRQDAQRSKQKETKGQLYEQLKLFKEQWEAAQTRRDQVRQRQLAKQILELKRRIEEGDYSKVIKTPVAYNDETKRLEAQRNFLRKKFDRMAAEAEHKNRSRAYKLWDTFLSLRRAVILSGMHTIGKLTSAALLRIGVSPVEHAIQHGLGMVPGLRGIAARAPVEGRFSPSAEGGALKDTFSKETLREMALKFGNRGTNDLLYGHEKPSLHPWLEMVGQLHAALKTPAERNFFGRAQRMRSQWEAKQAKARGLSDSEVADYLARPDTQAVININAYNESMRAVFKHDNVFVKGVRALQQVLRNVGKNDEGGNLIGKAAAGAVDYLFPVVKIPSNYIGEAFSYLGGAGKAAGQLWAAKVLSKGVDSLTPEQADYIMRNLGKQTVGLALAVIGYAAYQSDPKLLGTFYQQGDNKRKVPHEGNIGPAPAWLVEHPSALMLTFGANFARIQRGIKTKTGKTQVGSGDNANAAMNSVMGLLRKTPYIDTIENIQDKFRNKESVALWAGNEAAGATIQPDIKRLAKSQDENAAGQVRRRYPRGFVDAYKANVPGLREQVPTRPPRRH